MLKSMMAAAVAALISITPAAAADKVSLLLNWYPSGEHIPFFHGIKNGIFEKEGIELEILDGRGSGTTVQAVAAGSATFGYADFGTMAKAVSQGARLKAVGVVIQRTPLALIGFAEKNIRTPQDLKGRTLITTPGDASSQIFPIFLSSNGLTDADFTTLSGDANAKRNAVLTGQADVMVGFANVQPIELQSATGKDVTSLLMADFGIDMLGNALFAPETVLSSNPDLARRFLKATLAAFEATLADVDEGIAALRELKQDAPSADILRFGWEASLPLLSNPRYPSSSVLKAAPEDVSATIDTLVNATGLQNGDRSWTDYLDASFLP